VAWTIIGIGFIAWLALVILFTPRIDFHVTAPLRPDSDDFLRVVQSGCQASMHAHNQVEVLTNGAQFYPAMRDAIRAAENSINLEAYIMQPGTAADMLIDAMVERAKAGVEVRIVLDAIGSTRMGGTAARRLRDAGCQLNSISRFAGYRLHRLNNRTHRELMVVDGKVAFTGGAGIADWWLKPEKKSAAWRDTMVRIDGPVVSAVQGVFAENWLECCGEILTSYRHWPTLRAAGGVHAMVVKSSPSDRATASRVVFQMLIEGAVTTIDISTPYFLPDRALRRALVRAAARGVRVRVVVPGRLHRSAPGAPRQPAHVSRAARRRRAHLRVPPAMTHVKALIVDEPWA
jgi:cardiolipin synthase